MISSVNIYTIYRYIMIYTCIFPNTHWTAQSLQRSRTPKLVLGILPGQTELLTRLERVIQRSSHLRPVDHDSSARSTDSLPGQWLPCQAQQPTLCSLLLVRQISQQFCDERQMIFVPVPFLSKTRTALRPSSVASWKTTMDRP